MQKAPNRGIVRIMFLDELSQTQADQGAILHLAREVCQAESGYEDLRTIDLLTSAERAELIRLLKIRSDN